MKKNTIFKILGITILVYCILSWILPATAALGDPVDWSTKAPIGLFNLVQAPFDAWGGFAFTIIFILLVGGFYGILEETGVYDKILNSFAERYKGKEKIFLIVTMVLFALISSVAGLELGMFLLFPLVIAMLIKMGYDKIVAVAATFGATIIGMFGATISSTMYETINFNLQLEYSELLIVKIAFLVLGLGLLIFFTLMHDKKIKSGKDTKKEVKKTKKPVQKDEAKKEEIVVAQSKKSIWPAMIVLYVIIFLFIIGTISWGSLFDSNWFATAHEAINNVKIGNVQVFAVLFDGLATFGEWADVNRLQYYSTILVIGTLIVSLIYRIKFNDMFKGFTKGLKDYLVPAILVTIASTVFVLTYYHPVFNTIGTWIMGITEDFNVLTIGTSSIFTLIGSFLFVDFYYFTYYALGYLVEISGSANLYSLVSVMFVSMYSIAMLFVPTGVLMIATLKTSDTKYFDWIKFVWKLVLALFVVAFIAFIIIFLVK